MVYKYISNWRFGVEFELECNEDFQQADYHDYDSDAEMYGQFTAMEDSSVNCNDFDNAVELISGINRVSGWTDVVKEFQGLFNPMDSMSSQLCFNNSTGCHIHISVPKCRATLNRFLNKNFIPTFKRNLFKQVKKTFETHSTVEHYRGWQNRYFRYHATRIMDWTTEKYSEIRVNQNHDTLEFRSFHLYGVTTWKHLFSMFEAFFTALDKTIEKFVIWEGLGSIKYEAIMRKKDIDTGYGVAESNIIASEGMIKSFEELQNV